MLSQLRVSWPTAPPLYHVSDATVHEACYATASSAAHRPSSQLVLPGVNKIVVMTGSSTNRCQNFSNDRLTDELDTTVLAQLDACNSEWESIEEVSPQDYLMPAVTMKKTSSNLPTSDLPEVTCVSDDIDALNIVEMEGIDLDAIIDGLDDVQEDTDLFEDQFDEGSVIELYKNVDLHESSATDELQSTFTKADDEYLGLGYKKIIEYPPERFELSHYRALQMVNVELSTALGYPTVSSLVKKGIVRYRRRGRRKLLHAKVIAPCRDDSDTDTASEGGLVSAIFCGLEIITTISEILI